MKTKIIVLSLALALVPAMAQAKTYHAPKIHTTKLSSLDKYTYTIHRSEHIRCPYTGCKSDFTQH